MKDGGYYDGDFVNGEITGKGERLWSNGNVYVGKKNLSICISKLSEIVGQF